MPLRVMMTCFGCSSTGSKRTNVATSSAVFHFASCPRRFRLAQTLVWMILRDNCPERGLKMKIAPLIGLVVKLPSNILWIVTRYTLLVVSSSVDEPDDLVGESLGLVLAVEVGLHGLRRIQLKTLADLLAQDMTCQISLHDLGHGLALVEICMGKPTCGYQCK